ncbi:hypothetical protein E2562_011077 [Oryza meyeriana var. granulata]|uniref:Uncharacterized protein n=1 Tax=Oryza meyeriana var. granulata TaxID=110450 RepID=A0A6G1EWM9_9ORYZ|nr:hypothetical protein E2562_011077 [Oryza meyeriana var. granulata]
MLVSKTDAQAVVPVITDSSLVGHGEIHRPPNPLSSAVPQLRKPVFTTIDHLRPQTHGHTLTARVMELKHVVSL